MLRGVLFSLGLLSGTILSQSAFADTATLQIIVSKDKQSMTVYDGETVVQTTKVSTGKAGHTTPSGIFSILEKRKYHESNIYSNAPMPFMQRLTWSGIALHEGHVPNYPASHGCVRIPPGTAKTIFDMTDRGVHVVISDAPVAPVKIDNANLFMPLKPSPNSPFMSDVDLRPTVMKKASDGPYRVAMAGTDPMTTGSLQAVVPEDAPPLRILVHRRGARETMMDVQSLLLGLGFDAGAADGIPGPMTRDAIAGYKRWKGLPLNGPLVSKEFLAALYHSAGQEAAPAGQILVRRSFEPLFEAPVGIKDPERALGTHFYTADHIKRDAETAEWHAVTLENKLTADEMRDLGIEKAADASQPNAAAAALDRLEIPKDVREEIAVLMTNGTSLTITDQGLGPETGKGTDFVTLTKSEASLVQAQPAQSSQKPARRSKRDSYVGGIGLY
ncbi:L,D-transpeptidase catalytic domain [Rhizobium sp. NFR07]|uniref:L,D-transpeptidase family protein n=1 Tax=Rhizobium sp. NFR07 TaxID=1566262 RepID=UPI0008E3A3E3|nr:L,D-transpeptidase family protein [Rhizobium sp. NFR07]SFB60967.1 L,D-transpeptidase catalytic domain [Rhizobium sp. NFR07]